MAGSGPLKPLSEREQQLIEMASNGFTDVAIGQRLGISIGTVATYWARVRTKYGPYPRTELIAIAIKDHYEHEIDSLKAECGCLTRSMEPYEKEDPAVDTDKFYRYVVETAADATLVVNESGTINWVNDATCELFGYQRSDLVGRHVSILVPDLYKAVHTNHVRDFFENPMRHTMAEPSTAYAMLKDGSEKAVVLTLAPVKPFGEPLVVCTVRPLSSIAARQLTGKHPQG